MDLRRGRKPEGNFYALSIMDGSVHRKYPLSGVLGCDLAYKEYPAVISIAAGKDCVWFAAQKRVGALGRESRYDSRIIKLTENNETIALLPDENMDTAISRISCNLAGNEAVFGTSNWKPPSTLRYGATLYFIKGETIGIAQTISPEAPYQNTTLKQNPQMSANGAGIVCLTGDGRAVRYDDSGREAWRRALSRPQEFDGISLNAIGLHASFFGDRAAFVLGGTYNRSNYRLPTPIEDPNSNMFFLFNEHGDLLVKEKIDVSGGIESISQARDYLFLSIGRDLKNKRTSEHGVIALRADNGKLFEKISTNGPCLSAAASEDGKFLAAMEAPLQLPNGKIIGSYRLHFFARKDTE